MGSIVDSTCSTPASEPASDSFVDFFDRATRTRKGLCPVTVIRHQDQDPLQSHSLYFEQHGSGPIKVLFIMGLNSSMFAWEAQVNHFGRHGDYSAVVFDNRGVGNSSAPKGPYTTSGMAEDVIVLLGYIGWTEQRSFHVVGLSLGGMIAQELATRIPERIISLTLAVTTPGGNLWNNLPTWTGVLGLTRLLTVSELSVKISIMLDMSFPVAWLESKAEGDKLGRTNREVQRELYARRLSHTRRQTLPGAVSQMCAGLTHYVSPERLGSIARGVPRVMIITGDEDWMVEPRGSERIWDGLVSGLGVNPASDEARKCRTEGGRIQGVEIVRWEKTGHPIHIQWPKRFNAQLEMLFGEQVADGTDQ